MRVIVLSLMSLFCTTLISAQGYKIKGSVISAEDKNPMPYVTIQIGETGTYTDKKGEFSLTLASPGEIKIKERRQKMR